MGFLSITIIAFLVIETLNVLMLFFLPGSKRGNGLGVFNAFEESKKHPKIHSLIIYLINWVAATKLIFIALLIVILINGNNLTRIYAVGALCISICAYFFGLYPHIKQLDKEGQITPKGYSRTLTYMVIGFLAVFSIALGLCTYSINKSLPPDLNGSWKLVEATSIRDGNTVTTNYTKYPDMIKVINDNHFSFLHQKIVSLQEEPTIIFGSGRYTIDKNHYTEYTDYCNDPKWVGYVFDYTISLDNDTLKLAKYSDKKIGPESIVYVKIPDNTSIH